MLENEDKIPCEKTVVVLTAVSVGSVGQRASDLLIQNFGLKYFGRFKAHDCVSPIVGPDPFGGDSLCTSFMAYYGSNPSILLIQQRSDFIRHKKKVYLDRLMTWLTKKRFRAVILLTSTFVYARSDDLTPLHVFTTKSSDQFLLERQEQIALLNAERTRLESLQEKSEDKNVLPGSGIAQALYRECLRSQLLLIVVNKYCMQGNNITDAVELASACAHLLVSYEKIPKSPEDWKRPQSWIGLE